jgi:hypothetical protein
MLGFNDDDRVHDLESPEERARSFIAHFRRSCFYTILSLQCFVWLCPADLVLGGISPARVRPLWNLYAAGTKWCVPLRRFEISAFPAMDGRLLCNSIPMLPLFQDVFYLVSIVRVKPAACRFCELVSTPGSCFVL